MFDIQYTVLLVQTNLSVYFIDIHHAIRKMFRQIFIKEHTITLLTNSVHHQQRITCFRPIMRRGVLRNTILSEVLRNAYNTKRRGTHILFYPYVISVTMKFTE